MSGAGNGDDADVAAFASDRVRQLIEGAQSVDEAACDSSVDMDEDTANYLEKRCKDEEVRCEMLLQQEAELKTHLMESAMLGQQLVQRSEQLEQENQDLNDKADDAKRLAKEEHRDLEDLVRKANKLRAEAENLTIDNSELQDRMQSLQTSIVDMQSHVVSSPVANTRADTAETFRVPSAYVELLEEEIALRSDLASQVDNQLDKHAQQVYEGKENLVELMEEINRLQDDAMYHKSLFQLWQTVLQEDLEEANEMSDGISGVLHDKQLSTHHAAIQRQSQVREHAMGINRYETMFSQMADERQQRRDSLMHTELFQLQVLVVHAKQRLEDHDSGKTVDMAAEVKRLSYETRELQRRARQLEQGEHEAVKYAAAKLEALKRWRQQSRMALEGEQKVRVRREHRNLKLLEKELMHATDAIRMLRTGGT